MWDRDAKRKRLNGEYINLDGCARTSQLVGRQFLMHFREDRSDLILQLLDVQQRESNSQKRSVFKLKAKSVYLRIISYSQLQVSDIIASTFRSSSGCSILQERMQIEIATFDTLQ